VKPREPGTMRDESQRGFDVEVAAFKVIKRESHEHTDRTIVLGARLRCLGGHVANLSKILTCHRERNQVVLVAGQEPTWSGRQVRQRLPQSNDVRPVDLHWPGSGRTTGQSDPARGRAHPCPPAPDASGGLSGSAMSRTGNGTTRAATIPAAPSIPNSRPALLSRQPRHRGRARRQRRIRCRSRRSWPASSCGWPTITRP
jgi:hypothetical protein